MLFAFDVLMIEGEDVRSRMLGERQAILFELLLEAEEGIAAVEPIEGDSDAILRAACSMGLEGIVAKRIDRPYRSGDREDWIKVRCTQLDHFAVIGFDPAGPKGVASLKLAKLVDGELVPCG
jgi:bifunctional non-homologous end joining protein LigD